MFLAIETSTKVFSVSVGNETQIIGEIFSNSFIKTSQFLIKYIDILLKDASIKLSDLKRIICTTGPGSFTGIRIGLSVCKTLSQILNIPIIGIPTLDIVAYKTSIFVDSNSVIVPVINALCNEVYTATYILKNNDLSHKKRKKIIKNF